MARIGPARRLAALLADPSLAETLSAEDWTGVLTVARAERLAGSLARGLDGLELPGDVARILAAARAEADLSRTQALWEAEMARRALAPLGMPVVLLKGSAFVAAGLSAGAGRMIGDLDILVPGERIDAAEAALLAAGWDWVKPDPYDDHYYRTWMHELPPLIHRERDRMIDVHHTILPLTARPHPDAAALIANSVALENGLRVLSPPDMIVHAAAHLIADGDLAGGMRNLWDIDRLVREQDGAGFRESLEARARLHGLSAQTARALRLSAALYGTPGCAPPTATDRLFLRAILARNGWGRRTHAFTRQGFYIRSHLMRMPPHLLARHLWTKWRKARAAA